LNVSVVIPALDEEGAIGEVVSDLRALRDAEGRPLIDEVVVGDNGSRDRTAEVARAAGATVVFEPRRGYGSACLKAIEHLGARAGGPPKIVVFADGDGSNDPSDLPALIAPIADGEAELVIGSRPRLAVPGSLTVPQIVGNVLASRLLGWIYGAHCTDLGPFRAISWNALMAIGMCDPDYGWTVEMQIKAAKHRIPVREIDVQNRARRAGRSKVGGTVRGVVGASYKIISTIVKYR
jgi:glycosyltransferase involved in cell wall biosynthesis